MEELIKYIDTPKGKRYLDYNEALRNQPVVNRDKSVATEKSLVVGRTNQAGIDERYATVISKRTQIVNTPPPHYFLKLSTVEGLSAGDTLTVICFLAGEWTEFDCEVLSVVESTTEVEFGYDGRIGAMDLSKGVRVRCKDKPEFGDVADGFSADNSFVSGEGNISTRDCQTVRGSFAKVDKERKYVDIVGGGTDDEHRENLYTLDEDGNAVFFGTVTAKGKDLSLAIVSNAAAQISGLYTFTTTPYIISPPYTNYHAANKKYVDDKIAEMEQKVLTEMQKIVDAQEAILNGGTE